MSNRLVALAAIALVIALAALACSGNGDDPGPTETEPEPTTAPTATPTTQAAAQATEPAGPDDSAESEGSSLQLGETIVAPEGQRATEAPLLTPVSLRLGQKLASPSLVSGLTIDFVEVVEDTRCPAGAECPSPGSVTVRIKTASGVLDTGDTTLVLQDGQTEPTVKKLGKFSAVFISLEPLPEEGKTIAPEDYVGTFAVLQ